MTDAEIKELYDRILSLYIQEVKDYYNQPRYTERADPHTMLSHLWWVLERTKERFINWKDEPEPESEMWTAEDIEMLRRGKAE